MLTESKVNDAVSEIRKACLPGFTYDRSGFVHSVTCGCGDHLDWEGAVDVVEIAGQLAGPLGSWVRAHVDHAADPAKLKAMADAAEPYVLRERQRIACALHELATLCMTRPDQLDEAVKMLARLVRHGRS
jgi:hypothetical protein